MATEATPPNDPSDDAVALRQSIERLEAKNRELKAEKDRAKAEAAEVDALRKFKADHEQAKLEAEGNYTEARKQLQEQYTHDIAAKDSQIQQLEARVRELEVMTPAIGALADLVHDPQLAITSKLGSRTIEREPDGSVVVVDGLSRQPVADWARSLPGWMQKNGARPQGSGAPASRPTMATASDPDLKFFVSPAKGGAFSLTEQGRILRTNRDRYEQLRELAKHA
jgi:hypothetical protein